MNDGREFVQMLFGMVAMGFVVVIAGLVLNVLIGLGRLSYRWVLDLPEPNEEHSWLMGKLANLQGYTHVVRGTWKNSKGKERHLSDVAGLSLLAAFFTPLTVYLSIKFYPVVLSLLLAFGLAHLARFSIRLSRVLKKHVADPDAHKGDRNE